MSDHMDEQDSRVACVAMIEDEVVTRRRWLDRQHFLDLVASVNFIPGPNSTELAIHLGLIRAGFAGLGSLAS